MHDYVHFFAAALNHEGHTNGIKNQTQVPPPNHKLINGIVDPLILKNLQAVESVVAQLDLSPIEDCYTNSGSPSYPPVVMLQVALYCILDGDSSPRKWARKVQSCLVTKYLSREQTPSISAFYRFRDKALHYIDDLFKNVLKLAEADGFLTDKQAAVDGTYESALASRHRLVNEKTLDKRIAVLEQAIEVDENLARPIHVLIFARVFSCGLHF